MSNNEANRNDRMRSAILIGLVLVAITCAVYWQVGEHGFLTYDDDMYVTQNLHVLTGMTSTNTAWAFSSAYSGNWHPVTWLSHQADVQFHGMNPRGHHLTNVLIHSISVLILLLFLARSTGKVWQSSFVAALFAFHPMHVESVAWVAERKDVLAAFFGFLTLLFYTEYVARRRIVWYALSFSAFVLGLMSKPMLVTIPLLMLLLDYWPLNRYLQADGETEKRSSPGNGSPMIALLREKIPFIACSFLSAAITIYAQSKGRAIQGFETLSIGHRIENAIIAYGKYLLMTFWPHDLAVLYPLPSSFPLWQIVCSLLLLGLISTGVVVSRKRHPYMLFGWFWFLGALLPVIGLIQVGSQSMADRYTYIPHIGLFVMCAWGGAALAGNSSYRQRITALLACMAILGSIILTWHQLGYWRNDLSLFQHALAVTENNYIMHNNLGTVYYNNGDLAAAADQYTKAITLAPNYAEAHANLGVTFALKGDVAAAVAKYREALQLDPACLIAHYNLGSALGNGGDLDAAIKEFQEALSINPNFVKAIEDLNKALLLKSRQ